MRIACVQANVAFNDPAANSARVVKDLEWLKQGGTDLAIFPEAFLTGYCVGTAEAGKEIAINATAGSDHVVTEMHESLAAIHEASERLDIGCVVGFAGTHEAGLYNGAILFEPGQAPRRYIKTHLPILGFDRFVLPGDDLPVFETRWGKIGILICYDLRPPEAARALALKGAELIVLPTNWPIGAEVSAELTCRSRSVENLLFFATCNRVGVENGTSFIGLSKIIGLKGELLAQAGAGEEMILADIELSKARQKRIVNIPDEYEMEVFKSRRPELYGAITAPNQ